MSKIPAPTKMDQKKTIYSNSRAPVRKNKSHVCPRSTETAALKSRIGHLEKIIEELRSRNDTRDIEKFLQKNTIDHQSKLLEIIDRDTAAKGETEKSVAQHHDKDGKMKNQEILLDIRTNFIEHLLEKEKTVRNLLKEKQSNEYLMRQTECLLLEKEKMIEILKAVIFEKDKRLAEMELIGSAADKKEKSVDRNSMHMKEWIGNLAAENLRFTALRSLTQV